MIDQVRIIFTNTFTESREFDEDASFCPPGNIEEGFFSASYQVKNEKVYVNFEIEVGTVSGAVMLETGVWFMPPWAKEGESVLLDSGTYNILPSC